MLYKFHRSVVGGTFDRFHLGHQKLLKTAFEQSEHVAIGIATNELFKNKKLARIIEEYSTREQSVLNFLLANGFKDRFEIVPIHDFYGTTIEDETFEAIFITESNKENVAKINQERERNRFAPLEVIIVPYVFGNDGEIISSERIRKGHIDREGKSYIKLFEIQEIFHLPTDERDEFRNPIGDIEIDIKAVLKTLDPQDLLIAVGDIVAASFERAGRLADINITDGRTRRHTLEQQYIVSSTKMIQRTTKNQAGTITQEAAKTIQAAISDFETTHAEQLINVLGEEDLLAIPAILLAPLDTIVIYGQFNQGIVFVKVSEQNKKHVQNLFRKFQ